MTKFCTFLFPPEEHSKNNGLLHFYLTGEAVENKQNGLRLNLIFSSLFPSLQQYFTVKMEFKEM